MRNLTKSFSNSDINNHHYPETLGEFSQKVIQYIADKHFTEEKFGIIIKMGIWTNDTIHYLRKEKSNSKKFQKRKKIGKENSMNNNSITRKIFSNKLYQIQYNLTQLHQCVI